MATLVPIKSNADLEAEEAASKESERNAETTTKPELSGLVQFIRSRWDQARRAKITYIEPIMLANLRQSMGIYDNRKLAAIRAMGAGSEINLNHTGTKCFNARAWINDILFQPHAKCWGVEPTPEPEIEPDLLKQVEQAYYQAAMGKVIQSADQSVPMDMASVVQQIQATLPEFDEQIHNEVKLIAEKKARRISSEIDDKLTEGGWYRAMADAIYDIVSIKTGFIKSAVRMRNKRVMVKDENGKKRVDVVKEKIREYERRSPFDIYPEPDSISIDDGYLFDHVSYRRSDLQAMIGVDGFNADSLRAILTEHQTGGLKEWTGIEAERTELEKKDMQAVYQSNKIEGLEYHGPVPGGFLREWGFPADTVPEVWADYEVCAVLIGNHVPYAVLNPHPLGKKPFAKASYEEQNDSFWGRALPERIAAPASAINSGARALVNNLGMGSGPQVEINIDRLLGGEKGDTRLIPWKKWLTHNRTMQSTPAIQFWQPNMHAQEIMNVIKDFQRILDEQSSIPAYAHGDPQVGGAGNTASGLSMMITQASRAIKAVIKNIDDNLIIPTIQYQYDDCLNDPKNIDYIGDIKLVAKGSQALIEKEQRAIRMIELINASENPYAAQVIGPQGLAFLWGEVAKSYDMPVEKVVTGQANVNPAPPGTEAAKGAIPGGDVVPGNANLGGTPPGPTTLNAAGATPSGAETQLITGKGGHPTAA